MDLSKNVGGRNRLARTVIGVVLAVVAIGSLRKGKRLRGILAGVGALALGYDATTGGSDLKPMETLDIDATGERATDEGAELRCATCGQPIRPGQGRGPNENNEIVHDACKAPAE